MRKLVLLALSIAVIAAAAAQIPFVTVTGVVNNFNGTAYAGGVVQIAWPDYALTSYNFQHAAGSMSVTTSATGSITVGLNPTDIWTAAAPRQYTVTYIGNDGVPMSVNWQVASSPTTTTVAAVAVGSSGGGGGSMVYPPGSTIGFTNAGGTAWTAPTYAPVAALWVGTGCGTATNVPQLNGNCVAPTGSPAGGSLSFQYNNSGSFGGSPTLSVDSNSIVNNTYSGTTVNHQSLMIESYTGTTMGAGPGSLSNILVEEPIYSCCTDTTAGDGFSNFAANYGTMTLANSCNGCYINHVHYNTANILDQFNFTNNAGAEIVWNYYAEYIKSGSATNTEHVGYEDIPFVSGTGNLNLNIGFRHTVPVPSGTGTIGQNYGVNVNNPTSSSSHLTMSCGVDIGGSAAYNPGNNYYGLCSNQFWEVDNSIGTLVILGPTSTAPLMTQQTYVWNAHGRVEDNTGQNYNGIIMLVDGCCGGTAGTMNAFSGIVDTPGTTTSSLIAYLATIKNDGGATVATGIGYEATAASLGSGGALTNTYMFYAHGFLTGTQTNTPYGFLNDVAGTKDGFQQTSVATLTQTGKVLTASLPACAAGTLLQRNAVTDATSATPGAAPAGSGTFTVPVICTLNSSGAVYAWLID